MPKSTGAVAQTYFPEKTETSNADIVDIVDLLRRCNPNLSEGNPRLIDKDGKTYDLPANIFEPLLLIAQSLIEGKAVSVMPLDQVMTTQEAANFLQISRPTLVSLLERGDIPFEKVSRHRRVKLSDVVAYQEAKRREIEEGLAGLFEAEYKEGIADRTLGIPPAMR